MMLRRVVSPLFVASAAFGSPVSAAPVCLSIGNITVEEGPNTSAGTFDDTFTLRAGIEKVINAPSADVEEIHSQSSRIWFTAEVVGGGVDLRFDFQQTRRWASGNSRRTSGPCRESRRRTSRLARR